ncbi:ABC transporter permease [Aurantimonas sp. Leaf443]|uniref:ABC transporter permease n=1 Tax=Aurantimonas sp. Leaf443 TaxID=1736378 RepID=UPI0006FAEE27|nr:ABC transporter permease [Aurantimonas sp. Leaf443]KQT85100.1 branched-chain amino acid ABC transporter permease [Aurantimonas sp. Leaf443]
MSLADAPLSKIQDRAPAPRHVADRGRSRLSEALRSWEALLVALFLAIFLANSLASPYFLDIWNLSDATFNFTEKAIVALALAFVILSGEIDISVAGIIALASTVMGLLAAGGAGLPLVAGAGLCTGLACGIVNGALVTGLGLPSIVATIGTMSLFRGLSYAILGDGAFTQYPEGFEFFGQGYVWEWLSFEFAAFLVLALVAGIVLHRTVVGRAIRAVGHNPFAARFSGLPVGRLKFLAFVVTGLAAGLASVMLTSRLGSTRPSIALGWELEIVTMVVLGGVSINGGSGSILGVVLAAFVMGLITFGLGLLNVPGIIMSIFIGLLLIAVIALPVLAGRLARRFSKGPR